MSVMRATQGSGTSRRVDRVAAVLLAAVLVTGCGGFVRDTPAPGVYRLFAPRLPAAPALAVDLRVERPVAAAGLGDDRVATLWPGGRIDYLAGARWGDALPVVVGAALVEALAASGTFRSVQDDTSPFTATHVLRLEIRRFEADYAAGAPPVVRVTLSGSVGNAVDRRVVGTTVAVAEARATANNQGAVFAAFNEAFARATTDLAAALAAPLR
jgi:cholesterol transport system auxiliary component